MPELWSMTLKRRSHVLKHARALARTGHYRDHRSVLEKIRSLPDSSLVVERWLSDKEFLRQLDVLCAAAWDAADRRSARSTNRIQGSNRPARRPSGLKALSNSAGAVGSALENKGGPGPLH